MITAKLLNKMERYIQRYNDKIKSLINILLHENKKDFKQHEYPNFEKIGLPNPRGE